MQTIREQEETIKSLQEHIIKLEHINFQNEVSAVNMTQNSNFNASYSREHINIHENDKDIQWRQRVQNLET